MLFQKQKYRHNLDEGTIGDCHRTAIACLMNRNRDDVPHFAKDTWGKPVEFNKAVDDWLMSQGLVATHSIYECTLEVLLGHLEQLNPTAFYLLGGMSANGTEHTVIGHGGKIIWDPAIDNSGIVGPCASGVYWVTYLVDARFHAKSV